MHINGWHSGVLGVLAIEDNYYLAKALELCPGLRFTRSRSRPCQSQRGVCAAPRQGSHSLPWLLFNVTIPVISNFLVNYLDKSEEKILSLRELQAIGLFYIKCYSIGDFSVRILINKICPPNEIPVP